MQDDDHLSPSEQAYWDRQKLPRKEFEGSVPVYLPNNQIIGKASLVEEKGAVTLTINIPLDPGVSELLQEQLIGISFMYLSRDAKDMIDVEKLYPKNPAGEIPVEQSEGVQDGNQ